MRGAMTEPQGYGATWYAGTMVPTPERDRLTFDLDVDVCVVGAGLAGLTTAREIARRGWSVAGVEYVRLHATEAGMPGVEPTPGWLAVSKTDRRNALLRHAALLTDEL